jgi:hypothetical protein
MSVWVRATFIKMVIQSILIWWSEVKVQQYLKINLLKIKWFKKFNKPPNNHIKIIKSEMSNNFISINHKFFKKKVIFK